MVQTEAPTYPKYQNIKPASITRDKNGKIIINDSQDTQATNDSSRPEKIHKKTQQVYQQKYQHKLFNNEVQGEGSKQGNVKTSDNGNKITVEALVVDKVTNSENVDTGKEDTQKKKEYNVNEENSEMVNQEKLNEGAERNHINIDSSQEDTQEVVESGEEEVSTNNDEERVECSLQKITKPDGEADGNCNIQNQQDQKEEIEDDDIGDTLDGISIQSEGVNVEEFNMVNITSTMYHSDGGGDTHQFEEQCHTPTHNEEEFSKVKTKSQKKRERKAQRLMITRSKSALNSNNAVAQ